MEPMKPMAPMTWMSGGEKWWPDELGEPASSGGQNGIRYAFFSDAKRLLIEENGEVTTYDSGDHQINGVSQQDNGGSRSFSFSSRNGSVKLHDLKKVT